MMFFRAPQAKNFAILGVFVLERMHFSARKVLCARTRAFGNLPFLGKFRYMHLHTHLVRLKFRPPQNAYALLGKTVGASIPSRRYISLSRRTWCT